MSKWKGTPEGLNSAQAAMIHRTNRDEALDMLEEHSFGGLSDWMDWRTRKEALLDRLREPEEICHTCGAERGIHPKSWCEVPKKTVRERVEAFGITPFSQRQPLLILADAIDELVEK